MRDIKGWLYSEPDRYHEITDSYDAEYFRYGVISGSLDIEEQLNKVGSFTVTFNCKPYKYSFAGQQMVSVDSTSISVTNPTAFESRPYIKLRVAGDDGLVHGAVLLGCLGTPVPVLHGNPAETAGFSVEGDQRIHNDGSLAQGADQIVRLIICIPTMMVNEGISIGDTNSHLGSKLCWRF